MDDYMNNDQYNVFLENIAKLIEANAKTVEEAAQIVIPKCRNKKGFSPTPTKAKGKAK